MAGTRRSPSKRSLRKLQALIEEAGSIDELARWADGDYPQPKPGAPRNASLDVLLDMLEAYYGPHWTMKTGVPPKTVEDDRNFCGKLLTPSKAVEEKLIETQHAILRYYVEREVRAHIEKSQDKNLPADVRKAWDPKHLGRSKRSANRRSDIDTTERLIDSITRRLISRLRERAKTRKRTV